MAYWTIKTTKNGDYKTVKTKKKYSYKDQKNFKTKKEAQERIEYYKGR